MEEEIKPIHLLVGNIVAERYFGPDKEIKKGTKHFSGGTKIYIIDWYPGMCETIVAVGLNKRTKRIISICIKVNLVENLRIKSVYNKNIIKKVEERHGQIDSEFIQELAETMLKNIPYWQKV
ncbi:hypothetical protein [Flavobacterium sharifuzzamanii]|uniref:hypothetical protein n=1 Tax=Flavobacterium sharifuzzamanii TaxID=2211133 RepID=UPI000DAEEECE|nr:hypothetical protein [Flavobacterium sharifuzzamanii]KAF2079408.1 hypothetical protein DMA14_17840 [Flavobacterium sharifuzzamanii]